MEHMLSLPRRFARAPGGEMSFALALLLAMFQYD